MLTEYSRYTENHSSYGKELAIDRIDPDYRSMQGQIMLLQRHMRKTLDRTMRESDIDCIDSPQIAIGNDSLHTGLLGDGNDRGPCVYWVGSNPCVHDIAGQCSACGYNRIVFPDTSVDQSKFLRAQFERYKQRMDIWQKGLNDQGNIFNPHFSDSDKRAVLVTGFTGSMFDDLEVNSNLRAELLSWIKLDFEERNIDPQIYIEARAEDIVRIARTGEVDTLLPLLHSLHSRVILGFESFDPFVRQVIYAKTLTRKVFEEAIFALQSRSIGTNAFVFMGNHSMSEVETVRDVSQSLLYLKNLNVSPVLMTPSLTTGSFNDLLRYVGKNGGKDQIYSAIGNYSFTEPRTFLSLLRQMMSLNQFDPLMDHYPFMVSLGGGPPEPLEWMFNAPGRVTCRNCSDTIKHAARQLITNFDYKEFETQVQAVDECSCENVYLEKIVEQSAWPSLKTRVSTNITLAKQYLKRYLNI